VRFIFLLLLLGISILISVNSANAENYEITIPSGSNTENCGGNLCFDPISITIKQGDTITWVNQDDKLGTDGGSSAHQLASLTGQDLELLTMKFGETKPIQFHELGKTEYHCIIHPWMLGEIIVEERRSAYEIKDDSTGGDCNKIGNWDSSTRICKLDRDIDAALIIKSNYLEIDGNDHKIDGNFDPRTGFYECILANSKTGITIKKLELTSCNNGINFQDVQKSTIVDNKIYGNMAVGINIINSDDNIIKNNEIFENKHSGIVFRGSNNLIENNKILNNFELQNDKSIRGAGISLHTKIPHDNIIRSNTIDGHNVGINFDGVELVNTVENNIVSKNNIGIALGGGENLQIISNKIDNSFEKGISAGGSLSKPYYDNTIKGNEISNNKEGIYLLNNGNIVTENSFISNEEGLILHYLGNNMFTKNNQIFNNNFIDNDKQVSGGTSNIFTVKEGGNYWSDFSPHCDDNNSNGVCDEEYPFSSGTIGVTDTAVWKEKDGWIVSKPDTNKSIQSSDDSKKISEYGIASFVDKSKDPQLYIDRYNNEASYKEWFHENYPQYKTIHEAVGLELTEKIPEWVKNIFGWYATDQVSEDELLNAIKYLINEKILIVN
jgi:parallel beta-helix repeat protein